MGLDFCFNNSMIILALVVVVMIAIISLIILARDVVAFFWRRANPRLPGPRANDREPWNDEESEP